MHSVLVYELTSFFSQQSDSPSVLRHNPVILRLLVDNVERSLLTFMLEFFEMYINRPVAGSTGAVDFVRGLRLMAGQYHKVRIIAEVSSVADFQQVHSVKLLVIGAVVICLDM